MPKTDRIAVNIKVIKIASDGTVKVSIDGHNFSIFGGLVIHECGNPQVRKTADESLFSFLRDFFGVKHG